MATSWYYYIDGVEHGPVDTKTLVGLAQQGTLQPTHEVRRGDKGRRALAAKVQGLFQPNMTSQRHESTSHVDGSNQSPDWKSPGGKEQTTRSPAVMLVVITTIIAGTVCSSIAWLVTTLNHQVTSRPESVPTSPAENPPPIKAFAGDPAIEPVQVPRVHVADSSDTLFQRTSPAVIRVWALSASGERTSQGSGFFVAENGIVATNFHVIDGAHDVRVALDNDSYFAVSGVIACSKADDIALLKAEAKRTPFLPLRSEPPPPIGTRVFAIGSPRGLENTLSDGLLSGIRDTGPGKQLIQTTAPISPGSSGGPLLDEAGHVIGMTTSYLPGGQNLNFAVPSATILSMLSSSTAPKPVREVTGAAGSQTRQTYLAERLDAGLPFQARVQVTISGQEPGKSRIQSLLLRELRALNDVLIVGDDPLYTFSVVLLPDRDGGVEAAYYMSVVIMRNNMLGESKGEAPSESGTITTHMLMLRGVDVLENGIRNLVASFDTEQIEFLRTFYDTLLNDREASPDK